MMQEIMNIHDCIRVYIRQDIEIYAHVYLYEIHKYVYVYTYM
jgi:hypothetical protein